MFKKIKLTEKNTTYLLSFIIVLLVFQISYGLEILIPTNINWLMSVRHDWGQHYLGWAFYRNEPWTFPLGTIDSICYPVSTNVGYLDSIPLLAFFFKFFSSILPEDFQYTGAWLLFCHLMLSYYTVKIFKLYKIKPVYILIGVFIIACNPVLIYRGMHPSLCAHGFILASIYYYLLPLNSINVKQINRNQVYLLLVSALIGPYSCIMIIGFNFILPFKSYFYLKLLTIREAIFYPIFSCIMILLLWYIFGLLDFNNSVKIEVVNSYGLYGFNLNSFFNASGYSTFIPALKQVSSHQYEGFLYLGLGVMILAIIATICFFVAVKRSNIFSKIQKYNLPLFFLAIIYTVFAITNKVTWNDQVLFTFPLPEFILKIGGVFRASGRFIWIFYYLFLVLIILLFVKSKLPNFIKIGVLVILLSIQAYDTKLLYLGKDLKYGKYIPPLTNQKWENIVKNFDKIITYPPFNNHLLNPMDYQDLCFLTLKTKKMISTGYVAREKGKENQIFIDSLNANLSKGIIYNDELIVTTPQYLDAFNVLFHNKTINLRFLDGYYIIYPKSKEIDNYIPLTTEDKIKSDSIFSHYSKSNILRIIEKQPLSDKIEFNFEKIIKNNNNIQIKGWAFTKGTNKNKGDSIFITLSDSKKIFLVNTNSFLRPDITSVYKKKYLDDSGFSTTIFLENPEIVMKDLGLAIKDKTGQWFFSRDLGKLHDLVKEEFVKPKTINDLPKGGNLVGNVDELIQSKNEVKISGWAAFDKQNAKNNVISVVLIGEKIKYIFSTDLSKRFDVTKAANNLYNYDDSGFKLKIRLTDLNKGEYKVGIIVKNKTNNKVFLMDTQKKVSY